MLKAAFLLILSMLSFEAAAQHILNPAGFSMLGAYSSNGNIIVTTGGTPNWPGVGSGVIDPTGLAVFTFNGGFNLRPGDVITVSGPRPLAILVKGDSTIAGTINADGGDGQDCGHDP